MAASLGGCSVPWFNRLRWMVRLKPGCRVRPKQRFPDGDDFDLLAAIQRKPVVDGRNGDQTNDCRATPRGRRFRPGSCSNRRSHSARAVMVGAGFAASGVTTTAVFAAFAAALSSARLGVLRIGSSIFFSRVRRQSLHET